MHNVDGMLDRMTPQQFDEAMAFDSIEPLGLEKLYQLVGLIGAKLVQAWGGEVGDIVAMVNAEATESQPATVSPNQAAAVFRGYAGG